MQRYFISPTQINGDQIQIVGDDVHHIKTVMRSQIGDQFICCDGQGIDYLVEIIEIHSQYIYCQVIRSSPSQGEPMTQVAIAQSLPKGDKLEMILQKGTEIGAVSFYPFTSERTIVKLQEKKGQKKWERWQRIVKEAAEQSHRGQLPQVYAPMNWKQLLEEIAKAELALIAYEKGGVPLSHVVSHEAKRILLVIGPEGGFSEHEIEEAKAVGAIPITLGSRILRTETASLVALSCILFSRKDLGGETE
ncbi:16S rRNA (uracil(1498)-N(3))-methyltransferase [Thermoflavimicrobium daqui]|jgi:16S rRNA (uracil1498-N3)-methyltransferase|uniref:Ribosomal RNA small subunit methyltransferase E n=1 Tax=Thermoflavimicrobium daqui TaxID=2137476 RepID=A0A364K6B7_9BACL|nr:16S rRNA (uracil(1498)-N(3))-methyltransferase [Thermoflavimicrobium daqui]RAL25846.1 16S rRNA (uracil(1498)-N(3))-methyltransferase [Thermoflavimicrobium daqui]